MINGEREVPEGERTYPRPRGRDRTIAHSPCCSCFPGRVSSSKPSRGMEWLPSSAASMEHLPDFSKIEGSYLFSSFEDDGTERRKRFFSFYGRGQLCCKLGQQLAVGSSSLQFGLLPLAICCHSGACWSHHQGSNHSGYTSGGLAFCLPSVLHG